MSVMFQTLDRIQSQSTGTSPDSVAEAFSVFEFSTSAEPSSIASRFERAAKASGADPGILNRLSGLAHNWKPRRLLDIRFGAQMSPETATMTRPAFDPAVLWATTRLASRPRF
jgi:hypothetical protein